MRTPLDLLITGATLHCMQRGDLLSLIPDEELANVADIKNLCAKVHISLSDEIDSICALLGIRKRAFIEVALIEAVKKSHSIIESEGLYEAMEAKARGFDGGKPFDEGAK